MPKTRPPYPPQLRARLIDLARSGRSPEELGRQFEPSPRPFGTGSIRLIGMTAGAPMA
jgi:hypothetical protein